MIALIAHLIIRHCEALNNPILHKIPTKIMVYRLQEEEKQKRKLK